MSQADVIVSGEKCPENVSRLSADGKTRTQCAMKSTRAPWWKKHVLNLWSPDANWRAESVHSLFTWHSRSATKNAVASVCAGCCVRVYFCLARALAHVRGWCAARMRAVLHDVQQIERFDATRHCERSADCEHSPCSGNDDDDSRITPAQPNGPSSHRTIWNVFIHAMHVVRASEWSDSDVGVDRRVFMPWNAFGKEFNAMWRVAWKHVGCWCGTCDVLRCAWVAAWLVGCSAFSNVLRVAPRIGQACAFQWKLSSSVASLQQALDEKRNPTSTHFPSGRMDVQVVHGKKQNNGKRRPSNWWGRRNDFIMISRGEWSGRRGGGWIGNIENRWAMKNCGNHGHNA